MLHQQRSSASASERCASSDVPIKSQSVAKSELRMLVRTLLLQVRMSLRSGREHTRQAMAAQRVLGPRLKQVAFISLVGFMSSAPTQPTPFVSVLSTYDAAQQS